MLDQSAVMLVNQSRGDVPQLAGRQIHGLLTTRDFAKGNPAAVLAVIRAVYRAQKLIHADLKVATEALLRSGIVDLDRRQLDTILPIYEPAIPKSPEVSTEGITQANALFPGERTSPDLSKINLADYIAPDFARQAVAALG